MRIIGWAILALISLQLSAQDSLSTDTASLQEKTILIGVKPTPPFVIDNGDGSYSGISIDLWREVADELGLKYAFHELELPALLKALEKDSIDASINPLTVTSERVSAFHFTQPFFISSLSVATRADEQNAIWGFIKNFFSPAFLSAILLLFLVILFFGLLAWLFERRANPEEFAGGWKGIWDGVWWSAVTMTTVGYGDKSPKSAGGRIIAFIWMFTAIVIISGFTASIASALTVTQLGAEINTIDDLKKHKVVSIAGSTSERFLSAHDIEFTTVSSPEEALAALDQNKADAVVYDTPVLKYLVAGDSWNDKVTVLPFQFNTQYYAFALSPKHDKLADHINPELLEILEDVRYKAMLNEYHLLD